MASSTKTKQPSDVNSARNKLEGVLQTLMVKAEDSTTTDSSDEEGGNYQPDVAPKELAATSATKRGTGKAPRKRRKKDDAGNKDSANGNFSYVMKLFDRSVDLAKFSLSTPLYPICRAWMSNEPQNEAAGISKPSTTAIKVEEETPIQVDDVQDEEQYVTQLPSPLRLRFEEGEYRDMRIPSPLPHLDKFGIVVDADDPPSKDLLLSDHMMRWKEVRHRWREASFTNEERYRDSLSIIKSLKVVFE